MEQNNSEVRESSKAPKGKSGKAISIIISIMLVFAVLGSLGNYYQHDRVKKLSAQIENNKITIEKQNEVITKLRKEKDEFERIFSKIPNHVSYGSKVALTHCIIDALHFYNKDKSIKITPELVLAVIKVESNFKPSAKSGYGAMGWMQVIPSTARFTIDEFKFDTPKNNFNLYDTRLNIFCGIGYLRFLIDKFHSEGYSINDGSLWAVVMVSYNRGQNSELVKSKNLSLMFNDFYPVKVITSLKRFNNKS